MNEATIDTRPRFPVSAIAFGTLAILLVAAATIVVNYMVGERVRILLRSQFEVQRNAGEIEALAARRDLAVLVALDGTAPGTERAVVKSDAGLRLRLSSLERAISLEKNRAAFRHALNDQLALAAYHQQAAALVAEGRRSEARSLYRAPKYQSLHADFAAKIEEIQQRSHHYVQLKRTEVEHFLRLALVASILAIVMMVLSLYLIFAPTRVWARALSKAERSAASAAEVKSRFLATVSHEIRTPLNGVIGFAELLMKDPSLKPAHRRQVGLIQDAGTMLLTVVNDVLDYSKIEADMMQLDVQSFSLESLVDNCMSIMRPAADAKSLSLTSFIDPGLSPFYLGDSNRLRQIILNLLNNAVKFTESGQISLTVSKAAEAAGEEQLKFVVRDTGIGISPEGLAQLFRPFVQSDSSITRRFGGTGLGLSISRRLAEMMDGTLDAASAEGVGSVFTLSVTLPIGEAEATTQSIDLVLGERLNVLVVEDLPMNQELAAAMLRQMGHLVTLASDGAEGVDCAAKTLFDVILMDIQMPEMDGVTAARHIRDLPGAHGAVPIVAMTANTQPRQVAAYLAAGMDNHVSKPISQADLADKLALAVGLRTRTKDRADGPGTDAAPFDSEPYERIKALLPADRFYGHVDALRQLISELGARAEGDECLEAEAHKAGSQAGALGLMRISARARDLENACRENRDIGDALAAFRAASSDVEQLPRAA